jgi:hypothetical protein
MHRQLSSSLSDNYWQLDPQLIEDRLANIIPAVVQHKVALSHQDAICHGLHDRMIEKTLDGKINPRVQLKECIALGNSYSRHVITTNKNKMS